MVNTRVPKTPVRPVARVGRLDVDERRAQLLALGEELFNDRPYDEIAIDDIAAAAGISKGLLYHYFPSKKAFYVAAVRARAEELRAIVEPLDPNADRLGQMRSGVVRYLDFVEARPRGYAHVLRSGVGFDPEVAEIIEETRQAMCDRILEGTGVEHPSALLKLAVRGWVGFVESVSLEWIERRDDRKRLSRPALIELLMTSLQAIVVAAKPLMHVVAKVASNSSSKPKKSPNKKR